VDPKAVEISAENGTPIVRGEKKEGREEKRKNFHQVERFAGSFYQAIPLPPGPTPSG
jgi:HSP20 family protein